jgi:hypothetical protein
MTRLSFRRLRGYWEGGLRSRTRRAAIRTSEKAIRTSGDGLGRDSVDVSDAGEAIRTTEGVIRTRTTSSRTFGTRLGPRRRHLKFNEAVQRREVVAELRGGERARRVGRSDAWAVGGVLSD